MIMVWVISIGRYHLATWGQALARNYKIILENYYCFDIMVTCLCNQSIEYFHNSLRYKIFANIFGLNNYKAVKF